MKESLRLDFIDRTLRTTGIVLLIILLPGIYYFGIFPTLAVFFGGVWGMVNLIFLSALVRAALRPGHVDRVKVAGLALVKFPLLYLSGYFLLRAGYFEPLHLLAGFSMILAVMVLKVVAHALFGLDKEHRKNKRLSGAI